MSAGKKINDYDSEPVKYCAKCYSLKIKYNEVLDSEYCGDCGCSDVLEGSTEEWEKKYEKRHGHKFVIKNEDLQKSFIFSLTLEQIKAKVCQSDKWRDIIEAMYPHFPKDYSRADSLILFFHTVLSQNKIDKLKLLLTKFIKY